MTPRENTTLHGSATFLGRRDRNMLLNPYHKGFVIDGKNALDLNRSYRHMAVFGPTGFGKTTSIILPNLLRLQYASAFCLDPAGELAALTTPYLESQGYTVQVVRLDEPTAGTHGYNPLRFLGNANEVRKLTSLLIEANQPKSKTGDPFWIENAKAVTELLLKVVMKGPPVDQYPKTLWRLLNKFTADYETIDRLMTDRLNRDDYEVYKTVVAMSDKLRSSVLSSIRASLNPFAAEEIEALTTLPEQLNFSDLRQKKTVLFLQVPEAEVRYYGFLLSILYTQLFTALLQNPGTNALPVLGFLDEFANAGKLSEDFFPNFLTTVRKRNVGLCLVIQDVQQLYSLYKEDAAIILNSCASKLYLPGLGLETTERLEREFGTQTVQHLENGFGMKARERSIGRRLMHASEIRTLKDNEALYVFANKPPAKLTLTPWYKQRKLRRRANQS